MNTRVNEMLNLASSFPGDDEFSVDPITAPQNLPPRSNALKVAPEGVTQAKQEAVRSATTAKQAALSGSLSGSPAGDSTNPNNIPVQNIQGMLAGNLTDNQAGLATASDLEKNIRYANGTQLEKEYGGAAALDMVLRRNVAQNHINNVLSSERSVENIASDVVSGVGLGAMNGIGGIAALGAGIVNRDAGAAISQGLQKATEFVQGTQSYSLQERRKLLAAKNALDSRDSKAQYDAEIEAGASKASAGISRFLREAGNAVMNAASDGTTLSDGIAQGVGSMLPVGPLSTIGKVSSVALANKAIAAGKITKEVAESVITKGGKWGTAGIIGGMEAGGAYQESVNQILETPLAKLYETNTDFKAMVDSGEYTPTEARLAIANKTGITSAAITAPAAILLGKTVAKFEGAPVKVTSLKAGARNIATETAEETGQGAASQLAGNVAKSIQGQSGVDLLEGVGEAAGTSGLYGMGTAGTMQAPGLAAHGLVQGANAVITPAVNKMAEKRAINTATRPIEETVNAGVATKQATDLMAAGQTIIDKTVNNIESDNTLTPEEKAEKVDLVEALQNSYAYTPEQFSATNEALGGLLDEKLGESLKGVNNLTGAMEMTASHITENIGNMDEDSQINHIIYLESLMAAAENITQTEEVDAIFQAAGTQKEAQAYINNLMRTFSSIEQSQVLANAQTKVREILQARAAPTEVTPETQSEVMARVSLAPQTLAHRTVKTLIEQHQAGEVQLSPAQASRLYAAEALTRSVEALEGTGIPADDALATVTREVALNTTESAGQKYPSILQHIQGISQALAKGDKKVAAIGFNELKNLAQTLSNKVAAINASIDDPQNKQQAYENWVPSKQKWMTAARPINVKMGAERSVRFGQQVWTEAYMAANAVNALMENFPDLVPADKANHIEAAMALPTMHNRLRAMKPAAQKAAPTTAGVATNGATNKGTDATPPAQKPVQESTQIPAQEPTQEAIAVGLPESRKTALRQTVQSWARPEITKQVRKYERKAKAGSKTAADFVKILKDERVRRNEEDKQKRAALREQKAAEKVAEKAKQKADKAAKKANKQDVVTQPVKAPAETAKTKPVPEPETNTADAPAVPEAVPESAPDTVSDDAPVPAAAKTLAENPKLSGLLKENDGSDNALLRLFKWRKESSLWNRLAAEDRPVQTLLNALKSQEAFKRLSGKSKTPSSEQLNAADKFFRRYVPYIMRTTNAAMDKHLNAPAITPKGEEKMTLREYIMRSSEGDKTRQHPPETWKDGRGAFASLLSLVRGADGKAVGGFNPYILGAGAIAAAQWLLTAGNSGESRYTAAQVANILGIDEGLVTDDLRKMLATGLDHSDIIRGIADNIEKYLGITPNKDAPIFRAQSIKNALAAEIFASMVDGKNENGESTNAFFDKITYEFDAIGGILNITKTTVEGEVTHTNKNHGQKPHRTYSRYIPRLFKTGENTTEGPSFSTVMDDLFGTESGEKFSFSPDHPVSETQLRSNVRLSAEDKAAQEAQQKVPHKLNAPFVKFLEFMGSKGILGIFGAPELEKGNKNTLASHNGKNITVSSAFNQAMVMLSAIRTEARNQNIAEDEVGVYFKYETASTGRSMMQGKYNPQSDKTVRNMILPMTAKLNLKTAEDRLVWDMASIQMLGERVYELLPEGISAKAEKIFGHEDVKAVTQVLADMLAGKPAATPEKLQAALQKAAPMLKDGVTPEAVHVLLDRARLLLAEDGGEAFTSRLYVEADGVANGPAGAIFMLSGINEAENTYAMLKKAGFFIGQNDLSMNDFRQQDGDDLYTMAGINTRQPLQNKFSWYKEDSPTHARRKNQHARVLRVMESFFPKGDISMGTSDPKKMVITIKRGISKNPMTVTVYGSGASGIGSKLAKEMVDVLYERLTEVINGGQFDAGEYENYRDLLKDFRVLINYGPEVVKSSKGYSYKDIKYKPKSPQEEFGLRGNIADLRLTRDQFNTLRDNITEFFVSSLVSGIKQTVGEGAMEKTRQMITATQIQTLLIQKAYARLLEKKYAEKRAENPAWDPIKDGLSQNDLNALQKEYSFLSGKLMADTQQWDISESTAVAQEGAIAGRDLTRKYSVPALMNMPGDAGVKVLPYLVIGMGDAGMVQNLFNDPDRPDGILQVYDGVNIGLNDVKTGGRIINKAMAEAWMKNNPAKTVATMLERTLELADIETLFTEMSEQERKKIGYSLLGGDIEPTVDALVWGTHNLLSSLQGHAESVETLRTAIDRVGYSADQMAATGVPYSKAGTGTSDIEDFQKVVAEVVQENNAANPSKTTAEKTAELAALVESGKDDGFGNKVHDLSSITDFLRVHGKKLDPALASLVQNALYTNGKTFLKGARILVGSPQNIINTGLLNNEPGIINDLLNGNIRGLWQHDSKTLILPYVGMDTVFTAETLTHEIIHASTQAIMLEAAIGSLDTSEGWGAAVDASINEIQDMMQQFLNNEWNTQLYNAETNNAYYNMRETVFGILRENSPLDTETATLSELFTAADPVSQVQATNEFMAWTLTNRKLRAVARNKTFRSALKGIYELIKSVIYGDRQVNKMSSNMLSHLEFHTKALMRAQGSFYYQNGNKGRGTKKVGTLPHRTGASSASAANVEAVGAAFHAKVGAYLTQRFNGAGMARKAQQAATRLQQAKRQHEYVQAVGETQSLVNEAVSLGLIQSPREQEVFAQIVSAMMTGAEINPVGLIEVQRLMNTAVNKLSPDDFLKDPKSADPAELALARQQYEYLLGLNNAHKGTMDQYGRDVAAPVFLALGMLDPLVREALSKINRETIKSKNKTDDFEERLQKLGNNALASLEEYLNKQSSRDTNMAEALDKLAAVYATQTNKTENLLNMGLGQAQSLLDSANDKTVEFLDRYSKKLGDKARDTANNTNNKAVKGVAQAVNIISNLFNEDGSKMTAEAMLTMANQKGIPEVVSSLLKDLVGRTDSNGALYDMIKATQSKVSKVRQFFVEHLPSVLMKGFSKPPSEAEWTAMHKHILKTDLASLVPGSNINDVIGLVTDKSARQQKIRALETQLRGAVSADHFQAIQSKGQQLAEYMVTKKPSAMLLRNAVAVFYRLSEHNVSMTRPSTIAAISNKHAPLIEATDKLITLYALEASLLEDPEGFESLVDLIKNEAQNNSRGIHQLIGVASSQREQDQERGRKDSAVTYNRMKGYITQDTTQNGEVVVSVDSDRPLMEAKGFIRVADYEGSSLIKGDQWGYYFKPVSGNAPYNQGIIQNARMSSGGVDVATGYASGFPVAGRITQKVTVKRLAGNLHNDTGKEPLMPVFDGNGNVMAFERPIHPEQMIRLNPSTHAAAMLGRWMGRQAEESLAAGVNKQAIARTHEMWRAAGARRHEFVNILDPREFKNDPVMQDAIKLIPQYVRNEAQALFGQDTWMIRRDMLTDVIGIRDASVGDFWSGVSRWSPEQQRQVRQIAETVLGRDALHKLLKWESALKNVVKDIKTTIVVKSVVVPAINTIANIWQLTAHGVPMTYIVKGVRDKVLESEYYSKAMITRMDLQVKLMSEDTSLDMRKRYEAQIALIDSNVKRLSIWPLIEAGEFGSITDAGISRDDILLSQGKLQEFIEKQLDKTPDAVKTIGHNLMLTKDTALFQGLQKATEYGDFIAKAVLFDHRTKNKGMSASEALAEVTDAFVNYSRHSGRFRKNLENYGLAWFFDYKLRISEVAFAMLRKDPVRAALLMTLPIPGMELPISENIFTKAIEGNLGYSIGPGMAVHGLTMNPWIAAMH